MMVERFDRAFVLAAWLWALALPVAAVTAASPAAGQAGHAAAGLVYLAGSLLCHQRPERSFHLHGVALPVCARCAGIYAGAAVAGLVALRRRRDVLPRPVHVVNAPPARSTDVGQAARAIASGAVLVNLATLGWEWTTGEVPGHVTRALAGSSAGAAAAWIVVHAVRRDRQSG